MPFKTCLGLFGTLVMTFVTFLIPVVWVTVLIIGFQHLLSQPKKQYKITCSNDFETPISGRASTDEGSVHWKEGGNWNEYRIPEGVTCTTRVKTP